VLRDAQRAKKVSAALRQIHSGALEELKNAHNIEFLALPDRHSESDLTSGDDDDLPAAAKRRLRRRQ